MLLKELEGAIINSAVEMDFRAAIECVAAMHIVETNDLLPESEDGHDVG